MDVAAKYWVEIECQETVPYRTLDYTLRKKLAAEWSVSSGGDRIAFGDTSQDLGMGYMADSMSRRIISFDAVPGVPYNLALRISADLPEIASTDPTVKVSVDFIVFKKALLPAQLFAYLAFVLVLVGLLLLAPIAWRLLIRRYNDNYRNA